MNVVTLFLPDGSPLYVPIDLTAFGLLQQGIICSYESICMFLIVNAYSFLYLFGRNCSKRPQPAKSKTHCGGRGTFRQSSVRTGKSSPSYNLLYYTRVFAIFFSTFSAHMKTTMPRKLTILMQRPDMQI